MTWYRELILIAADVFISQLIIKSLGNSPADLAQCNLICAFFRAGGAEGAIAGGELNNQLCWNKKPVTVFYREAARERRRLA